MDNDYGDAYTLGYAGVGQKAPEASGVYIIYSPERWIYVGESDDIRHSLFQHLNEATPCMERFGPLSFSFELGPDVERMARWHALVAELEPACNRQVHPPITVEERGLHAGLDEAATIDGAQPA